MDNYERRIAYIEKNYGETPLEAAVRLQRAILAGTEDSLLTRNQRRRVRSKRGGDHRANPPRISAAERKAMLRDQGGQQQHAAVVVDGTRISDLPWSKPDADPLGDIRRLHDGNPPGSWP